MRLRLVLFFNVIAKQRAKVKNLGKQVSYKQTKMSINTGSKTER